MINAEIQEKQSLSHVSQKWYLNREWTTNYKPSLYAYDGTYHVLNHLNILTRLKNQFLIHNKAIMSPPHNFGKDINDELITDAPTLPQYVGSAILLFML